MNIVFHQGALGDWVLTFPILRALRPVYAVAPYSKANLAARLIDRTKPVGIEKTGFSQLYISGGNPSSQLGSSWCNILDDATLIISFISNGDDAWAANIRELASRAHHVFIRPQPPSSYRKHVTDWYDEQLRDQGVELCYPAIELSTSDSQNVVVHPGSGGNNKCWPANRFEKLVSVLRGHGKSVTVIYGDVERETWAQKKIDHWQEQLNAQFIPDLDQLVDVFEQAGMFIGNDTGPTHLAAAMGLHTIVLFGPSLHRVWSPGGPRVTVISPPRPCPISHIDVRSVLAMVKACS